MKIYTCTASVGAQPMGVWAKPMKLMTFCV